jgi:hypothetical protein
MFGTMFLIHVIIVIIDAMIITFPLCRHLGLCQKNIIIRQIVHDVLI